MRTIMSWTWVIVVAMLAIAASLVMLPFWLLGGRRRMDGRRNRR